MKKDLNGTPRRQAYKAQNAIQRRGSQSNISQTVFEVPNLHHDTDSESTNVKKMVND